MNLLTIARAAARKLLALVVLSIPPVAAAAEDNSGAWAALNVTGPVGAMTEKGQWNFAADAQARYFDVGIGVRQWLFRPSIGFRFTNGVGIRVGYARFHTRGRSGQTVQEDRSWQEIRFSLAEFAGATLDLRTRLEQRFVDAGTDTGHRLRSRLGIRQPVGANGARFEAYGEVFFTLNDADWAGSARFAQWRAYAGVSQSVGRARLGIGYQHQRVDVETAPDLGNHLLLLRLDYRFGD